MRFYRLRCCCLLQIYQRQIRCEKISPFCTGHRISYFQELVEWSAEMLHHISIIHSPTEFQEELIYLHQDLGSTFFVREKQMVGD